jgi:hypothetical protein
MTSPGVMALTYTMGDVAKKNEIQMVVDSQGDEFVKEFQTYVNNPAKNPLMEKFTRINIIPAIRALDPRPDPVYLVNSWLRAGTVNMFAGDGGSKKSYVAQFLANVLSLGSDFLGYPTTKTRVLYIDQEMGEEYILNRQSEIMRGIPGMDPHSLQIDFIFESDLNLGDAADVAILEMVIRGGQYGLVVLDAMADFISGRDENAAKDITPVFLDLRRIAISTSCSFLLLHHTTKSSGLYRGSTDIKSKVDLLMMVNSEPLSPTVYFKTEKNRHGRPLNFTAFASWSFGQFTLTGVENGNSEFLTIGEEYVLRCLEDGPKLRSDIIGSADGCTERNARDGLYHLVKKGRIYRTNPGKTGRGHEAIFAKKIEEDPHDLVY